MGELKIGRESQRQVEVSNDANYDFQAQSSSSLCAFYAVFSVLSPETIVVVGSIAFARSVWDE